MLSRGQSAIEWLVTHGWSVLIVLSIGVLLFHLGVFDAEAVPRFEGLRASGVQPVSDQVHLYSDGVLVLTVLNTRPYTMEVHWVEVSPVDDENDVLRTDLNAILTQGELGIFYVNASNLNSVSEASVVFPLKASADDVSVDFRLCIKEGYSVGGQPASDTACGIAKNIPVLDEPSGLVDCTVNDVCPCDTDDECPLVCQVCWWTPFGNRCNNCVGCPMSCAGDICAATAEHPEGECVPTFTTTTLLMPPI
ncbi:MAG: hypothetical protein ABH834_03185 [Candidatus Altiarchaeota archaeon]